MIFNEEQQKQINSDLEAVYFQHHKYTFDSSYELADIFKKFGEKIHNNASNEESRS